ncbi:LOW QUALITY PROTEIN: hypothetical protein Cgig2_025005 [Carnegiea gigantea]|uniref:Uncharacterized protein n=1 Tax=Carnegiea gigantea TaxID=171969 RepID=A0A9Q1GHP2_9CARY|nr:LOW QUALITY PROTEIN: hypothetical protein Cgig2_025005 [Carnegiea gigantea]
MCHPLLQNFTLVYAVKPKQNALMKEICAWFHAFFYIATNAYTLFIHENAMEKMWEKDHSTYHWLRDNEKLELWASLIPNPKCDDNTNNFVTSFSHAIVKSKLIGLHCKHTARCIFRIKQQLEDYAEDDFAMEKYRNLYIHIVHPIGALQMWDKRNLPNLDPLMLKGK